MEVRWSLLHLLGEFRQALRAERPKDLSSGTVYYFQTLGQQA